MVIFDPAEILKGAAVVVLFRLFAETTMAPR
jgi:hypothetical protein